MENLQMLVECTSELKTILAIVKAIINVIKWAIPILLIVMGTLDIAKIVISGNQDEKEVKAATKKLTTRVIYAVIIFLIPTIVTGILSLVFGTGKTDTTIIDCYKDAVIGDL